MILLRSILGVIAGYAIFVISALVLFKFSGIDPHANPSWLTLFLTVGYGLIFSFLGGFTAHWISGTKTLTVNYVLAFIMAGFAAFSFFKTSGNHYSQLAAIFLFAPASVLGGWFRKKKAAN